MYRSIHLLFRLSLQHLGIVPLCRESPALWDSTHVPLQTQLVAETRPHPLSPVWELEHRYVAQLWSEARPMSNSSSWAWQWWPRPGCQGCSSVLEAQTWVRAVNHRVRFQWYREGVPCWTKSGMNLVLAPGCRGTGYRATVLWLFWKFCELTDILYNFLIYLNLPVLLSFLCNWECWLICHLDVLGTSNLMGPKQNSLPSLRDLYHLTLNLKKIPQYLPGFMALETTESLSTPFS